MIRRIAFAIALAISSLASADLVYVREVDATNGDKELAVSVRALVQTTVSEEGRHQVSRDEKSADYELAPKLLRLGSSYILAVEKRKDGKTIFSQQMKAATADDLDLVAGKVTRAVIKENPVTEEQRVSEVTQNEETQGSRRKRSFNQLHFAMGPAFSSGLNASGSLFDFWLSLFFNVENAAIRGFIQSTTGEKLGSFGLGLGIVYFLSEKPTSPFLGGNLAYGSMTRNRNGNQDILSGFQPGVEAGYQFFRTASTNFDAAVWAKTIFSEYDDKGRPVLGGFRIGITF